jgi:hypothetical protein
MVCIVVWVICTLFKSLGLEALAEHELANIDGRETPIRFILQALFLLGNLLQIVVYSLMKEPVLVG